MHRLCKRTFDGPALSQTIADRSTANSGITLPLSYRLSFVAKCKPSGLYGIVCLLPAGSPPHVARKISEIILDAVDAIAQTGRWSDIRIEGRKTVEPAVADGDTAASIFRIGRLVGVRAAVFHTRPNSVFPSVG